MDTASPPHTGTLLDYLAVLRRRKWLVVECTLLVPLLALGATLMQTKEYRATAEVVLLRQPISQLLGVSEDPLLGGDPDRFAATQASLARTATVARRVSRAIDRARTTGQVLRATSVRPQSGRDLLMFVATDSDSKMAGRIAATYAREFSRYRRALDSERLVAAQAKVDREIAQLQASGASPSSPVLRGLIESKNELRRLEALATSNMIVTNAPTRGALVSPRPKRNAVLGLLMGLALGVGLAFLWEAVDRRVRSDDEVESALDLPRLGQVPEMPRGTQARHTILAASEPGGVASDAFGRIRSNVGLVNDDGDVRSIVVSSALPGEGKSTTAASLAAAFARAGQRVVLADLDLRHPHLDRLLGLKTRVGVTDVLANRASLDEALATVSISRGADHLSVVNGQPSDAGQRLPPTRFEVLPAGASAGNPDELMSSRGLIHLITLLELRADVVLLDSPPLLSVGDTLTLTSRVDALIVVVRMGAITRPTLRELRRVLDSCPARKLGFVAVGGSVPSQYGYGVARRDEHQAEEPSEPLSHRRRIPS